VFLSSHLPNPSHRVRSMGCLSSKPAIAIDTEPTREVRVTVPSVLPPPVVEQSPASLSRQSSRASRKSSRSRRGSISHREMSSSSVDSPTRQRADSTPEQPRPLKSPMPQDRRSRANSTSAPRSHRSDSTPPVPGEGYGLA